MEPIRKTLLSLPDDGSVLMHFIRSGFETPNPNWVDLPAPNSFTFRDPVDSFEEFQAMIKLSSQIFARSALRDLDDFLTGSSSAEMSFTKPSQISPRDQHQICLAIQMGATAAIRSVRQEFEGEVESDTVREYMTSLETGPNNTHLLISVMSTHHPLNPNSVPQSAKGRLQLNWGSTYAQHNEQRLLKGALNSLTVEKLQQGVEFLLRSLEEQMEQDRKKEMQPWLPRDLGITILQTYVDSPALKSGIWSVSEVVERHFLKNKIFHLLPQRIPESHSGWQFFMSGAGDITNPHIDPPLTRNIFWQVVGYKLWCVWPATSENLDVFEQSVPEERTWKWAMDKLGESGRRIFIMEPGTWGELKQSEIHACISLTPSVHCVQEFFNVDDAEEILRVWKYTEEYRQKDTTVTKIPDDKLPQPLTSWRPKNFDNQDEELDPMVKGAMDLYNYALEMLIEGKSDQVTEINEVSDLLPIVRLWIENHARSYGL